METVSKKANELFQQNLEPLMTAIQHDAYENHGVLLEGSDLLARAVALQLYALSKGKEIVVDVEQKLVILK